MSLFHPYICRKQKGFPNAVGYPSPFTLPLVLSVLTRWKGMTGQGTAVNFELRGVRRREWLRSGCCLLSLFGILGLGFLRTGLGGGSQLSSAPLSSLHPPFFKRGVGGSVMLIVVGATREGITTTSSSRAAAKSLKTKL